MLSNVKIGDIIILKRKKIEYEGKVIDIDKNEKIALKLNTGYIIGFNKENIEEIRIINNKVKNNCHNINIEKINTITKNYKNNNGNHKNISILATGGTISCISRSESVIETVSPKLSIDDILEDIKGINKNINIKTKQIMNKLSENIIPSDWIQIAKYIVNEIELGADGIVITSGTDTMSSIASAIAYMIETPIPIVFTGSQRSADRPSSDNYMNLICALEIATSDISEVTIVMHGTLSDDYCLVHRAVKSKKMHTSRRNTFHSINVSPIAKIDFDTRKVTYLSKYIKRNEKKLRYKLNLDLNCTLIKYNPSKSPEIIDYYIQKGIKGIVIEGVGMGHVSELWIPYIKKATDSGIIIIITSQCIYGRTGCNIYESGMKLMKANVIEGEDLIPESAIIKLMWLLGNFTNDNFIKEMIKINLVGEIEPQEYE